MAMFDKTEIRTWGDDKERAGILILEYFKRKRHQKQPLTQGYRTIIGHASKRAGELRTDPKLNPPQSSGTSSRHDFKVLSTINGYSIY